MRNPKWHRDEVILALDLYYELDSSQMSSKNQKIIDLSEILNKLPIHKNRTYHEKFRNPNGVNLKLANFKHFDPKYIGKGLAGGSKLDKEVLIEFFNQKKLLSTIAKNIKSTLKKNKVVEKLNDVENEYNDNSFSVKEGKVIYKLHKLRERDPKINKKKKEKYLQKNGKLDCEACGFDFYKIYGKIGEGYIEAHHVVPLSKINGETVTKLDDLALLCSNCHVIIHKNINTIGVKELKDIFINKVN